MSAIAPHSISSRITKPLNEVAQRQWTMLAARGILQTLVASLAMLLVVSLLLGWFTGLPVVARVALAFLGWGTVVWAAIHYLRPALHRWSLSRSAQFAEQSIPDSEERISSAVELSQTDDEFRGSAELVNHLVKQAEVDASRVKVADVVPFNTVFMWMLAFVPVLAIWLVLALNPHTSNKFLRGLFSTLTPWKAPPTVLADVAVKPGDIVLAQGDSLDVIAVVSANGGSPAKSANLIRTFSTGQSVSESLERVKGTQFTRTLDNLQQGFKYMVHTDRGESPTFNVTVNPRPEVARLDVRYDFPKYTGIEAKTQVASDGNIDALVGTKITLTVAASDSLVTDKSHVVFNEGQSDSTTIPLTPTAAKNVYTASFDVAHSGDYHIKLLNEYNLANKSDDARAITAEVDQPPVISISSPKEQITVRPDDEVTVMYLAGDDYGVAKIEALVQVDDKPEQTLQVVIHGKNRKNIKDQWNLSVPALLRLAGVNEATRISYQLKATDNRDPDPQAGLSVRQILLIDKNQKNSYQDTLNEMRKEDLQAAIRKAIERLTQASARINGVKDRVSRESTPDLLKEATAVRDHLANTGKDLSATAADYLDTPFAEVARKAKDIADNGIAGSADEMARLTLDSTNHEVAQKHGQSSYDQAIKARDDLQKLLAEVEAAEKKAEAAEELKQAAREQAEIAKEMAEHPEKVEEERQKQQDAINKLQEAIQKDPSLQNQTAQQLAQKLAELENKVEDQAQKQTELQNQTAKQEEQQQAEKAANALAEEQKKLNQQEQQFAKDDKKALDQAQAQTPDQNQQNQLVQNIEKNNIKDAAQEAQQAADQLKQDAQKLADQSKKADAPLNADQQQQQQQDQQNAQAAQDAQDLKNQAAQPQQNADANKQDAQKTEQAAQAIEKGADRVEQANDKGAHNTDAHKEAEQAKADAQQAAQDAQAAANAQNPQDAAKDEAKAAQEVAQAGQELNQAAQAEAKADQAQAQQQNQQAAAQAADQAQGLAQEQQQIATALAQQAQQQADAQQQGAQTPQQEAQAQQQTAQQTQQAQQAAQQLAQQAQAQQDQPVAQRAEEAAHDLAEAAKDQAQAAQAEAAGKPEDAAQAQADAQQELAKADQALRGNPEQAQANAEQGQHEDGQHEQGQPEQGQPEQGQPEQGHPEQGQGEHEHGQGQGHPEQTAAEAAQEAAQAQQQALQPNPDAAADAAQALAQAAQAAQEGLPGQEEGNEPGEEPGEEPGMHPGTVPHKGTDPKMGLAAQSEGGNNKPPASVTALGISGSDWAKLPPIMQRELMNASQQSGPPAYKEMIKNYYIRVARMQNERGSSAAKQ